MSIFTRNALLFKQLRPLVRQHSSVGTTAVESSPGLQLSRWALKSSRMRAGCLVVVPACLWLQSGWPAGGAQCEQIRPNIASDGPGYGRRKDGTYGPLSSDEPSEDDSTPAETSEEDLPLVSLDELREHVREDSLWVVYGGIVYDVTDYVREHPGGADTLLQAGGQDLEVIWQYYSVHMKAAAKPGQDMLSVLKPFQVGRLSSDDAAALGEENGPVESAAAKRASMYQAQRSRRRLVVFASAMMTASFWWGARCLIRALGAMVPWLGPRLAEAIACMLPCAVPGYNGAVKLPAKDPTTGRRHRVAVVGGGIAGSSCAYSLTQEGFDVTVYEAREQLGGNAQTASVTTADGKVVTQDLSVCYWAPEFYRNYSALLEALEVKPATIRLPYVIHHKMADGTSEYYCAPGYEADLDTKLQPSLRPRFAKEFDKYDRMINVVRGVTSIFQYGSRPSFYPPTFMSMNPCNYIGIRSCCKLFGMSDDFYDIVVAPFHGLNLTTIEIDSCPATALATLDAIVPMTKARWHNSWDTGNSTAVFKKLTKDCKVELNARVRQVRPVKSNGKWQQEVMNDNGEVEVFDRVVFACPAHAVANILRNRGFWENVILRAIGYHDDTHGQTWKDWLEAPVHQDLSCLPEEHRDFLTREGAFLIDVDDTGARDGTRNVEFTHNLGAWSPSARSAGISPEQAPLLMTQSLHKDRSIDPGKFVKTFSAPRGHPDLSHRNGAITKFVHLIQGRRGVYYCSNWTAPGNGHDLSCVTGLVVADAIGAKYPLNDAEAYRDFKDGRSFMGL